ncbi:MAG: hypothetical protein NTU44_08165 [Bacteroidetes bacterium]|nr:hypothetical protein [Bacteroidota bacterium]
MYHRFIQIDENWFGEQAYWLCHEGVVKLRSMPGILDFDKHMYLYHKLLVWIGSVIVWVAGWSVYPFKFATLFFYLLFFFSLFQYYKGNKDKFSYQQYILILALVVLVPIMVVQSFIFRPEIYVMSLGFISFYYLDKYLSVNKISLVFLAALFAGLAFLITLNGVVFPLAGAVLLLFYRRYKVFFLFVLICAAIGMVFTIDLWGTGHYEIFVQQLKQWPTRKFGEIYLSNNAWGFFVSKIINLLNEQQRFFWSDRVFAFSGLFLISYLFNFKYLRKNYRAVFIYLNTLVLALNLTGSHIAERYLIYYFPFMAVIVSVSLLRSDNRSFRYLQYVFVLLIVMNLFSVGKQFGFVFRENEDSSRTHAEILSKLPDKQGVIFAPWKFIFNEIGKHDFVSYQALQYYQDDRPKMDQASVTRLLQENYHVRYLILDRDITRDEPNDYDWFRGGPAKENTLLRPVYQDSQYQILEILS